MKHHVLKFHYLSVLILVVCLFLISCNKKDNDEITAENIKKTEDSLKACCEKKPSRFGNTDSL